MVKPRRKSRSSIGARRNPETERAILDAAEALILEGGGYAALSMDAVARRARAGKATLYKWWPTRARLLLAIYARRKATLDLADTGSLKGDLTAFYANLFRFWLHAPHGDLFRLVVAEAQTDPEIMVSLRSYAEDRRRDTEVIFRRAGERGELGPEISPVTAADIVVAVAWSRLLTNRLEDDEGIADIVAHLLAGLTPANGRAA